jgi:hypothetical protein
MNYRILLYPMVVVLAVGITACKQDVDIFTQTGIVAPPTYDKSWKAEGQINDTMEIRKFFNAIALTPRKDSVNMTTGGYAFSSPEMTVYFPANACVIANSGIAFTGKALVETFFIKKKGDMIRYDKPTISNGYVLESGGEIYIRATGGGQELSLAPNKQVTIRTFDTSAVASTMKLFTGAAVNANQFTWTPFTGAQGTTAFVNTWRDSAAPGRTNMGYEFTFPNLRWINCDYFRDTTNLTRNFAVRMTADTFTNQNTAVFAAFRDIRAVVKLWGDSASRTFTIPPHYRGLPIGNVVTVVTVSKIGERYYLGVVPNTTIANNLVVPVTPIAKTRDEILAYLLTL